VHYWDRQPATIDGVLGGYGQIHIVDTMTSHEMIEQFTGQISGFDSAVDFGAGIGRVAQATLLPKFKNVDLLEPSQT
jgi:protein N-terminal methyltransferase